MTPEHIHIAINHLPFVGSGFASIPIIVGLCLRNKAVLVTGLAMAILAGWTIPFVMETGEEAYQRYEKGSVRAHLDTQVEETLEIHEHRAEAWAKVIYLSALFSTFALGLTLWRFSWGRWVAILAAFLCLAALASGIWIAESGGKIRRPDFRESPSASSCS